MKKKYFVLQACLVLSTFAFATPAKNAITFAPKSKGLEFVANKGQWIDPSLYHVDVKDGGIFLENTGVTYVLSDEANAEKVHECIHDKTLDPVLKFHAYKMIFEGAKKPSKVTGNDPQSVYYNYFLGSDPAHWKSNIHPFTSVDYSEIYPGVNVRFRSDNHRFTYDFTVAPGADPNLIRLRYLGTDGVKTKNGKLFIKTSLRTVEELEPYAYQEINGERKKVACAYKVGDNVVNYFFPDGYNRALPLVIDPTVIFATYSGSTVSNYGFSATYDDQGNGYGAGEVFGSGYPVTIGAFQSTFGGNVDVNLSKYSSDGSTQLFGTYLGGNSSEQPHSLVVDPSGNLVVTGVTNSNNFPTSATAYDNTNNGGQDLFVTKFNPAGTALIGSTYIGGSAMDGGNTSPLSHNYGDAYKGEVISDNAGNVLVAGNTHSTNFPVTAATAYQQNLIGGQDGVVFKMNYDLSSLIWSTYIGGSGEDAVYNILLDNSQGHIFISGGTTSSNFPASVGAYQASYQGGSVDGFVCRFINGGNYTFERSTFVGTSVYDQCYGVQQDVNGFVYATGQSDGSFPVSPGVYSNANSHNFIIKMDNDLTTNLVSTVFGNGTATQLAPTAFLVDSCSNIYVSGFGSVPNMPLSPNPLQATTSGFYFIVFTPNMATLSLGTYYGINGDHVDGGTSRFDKRGIIYQGICCGSPVFPVTPTAYSTTNGDGYNLVTMKISFDVMAVHAVAAGSPAVQGCAPLNVQFVNNSTSATSYVWDFGDGSPISTLTAPSHTYTTGGTFTVMLAAASTTACIAHDTTYLTITVDTTNLQSDFAIQVLDSCNPYRARFTNTSSDTTASTTYAWDFGDLTTYNGHTPPVHNYATLGTYTVRLICTDPNALCAGIDTMIKTVGFTTFNVDANASIAGDTAGCSPFTVQFQNTSLNATSYTWDFGDGSPVNNTIAPSHVYTQAGLHTVRLIAQSNSPSACKSKDTTYLHVRIDTADIYADFSFVVTDSCNPYRAQFTQTCPYTTAQTQYAWDFGDLTTYNGPTPPLHTFPAIGTYNVRLIVTDSTTCNKKDTIIKPVAFTTFDVTAAAAVTPDTEGCAPFLVQFVNNSVNANSYTWDFGDLTPGSTLTAPSHTYTIFGLHTARLIAQSNNPSACKTKDTAYVNVKVDTANINANISYTILDSCGPYTVQFGNASSVITPWAVFNWDFGDATSFTGITPPLHTYPAIGTYVVRLIASDVNTCNKIDTFTTTVTFSTFNVAAVASAQPDSPGCSPYIVQFNNNSVNADSYVWDFGDNTPVSTVAAPSHTFILKGIHTVTLVAQSSNPSACKSKDTTHLYIRVDSGQVKSDFVPTTLDSCNPYRVKFDNYSLATSSASQYFWNLGDNTYYSGTTPPIHYYGGMGSYDVTLVVRDSTSCNKVDSITKTVLLNSYTIKAVFSHPDVCGDGLIPFYNLTENGKSWLWDFGDGNTDTARLVNHTYDTGGDYNVVLVAIDPQSCNGTDTAKGSVHVRYHAHAAFDFAPVPPEKNQPIVFTNQSVRSSIYNWSYGDGLSSTEKDPIRLYDWTGTFNVCLIANNSDNCPDTVCKDVGALIQPIADIPTAFTPNGDGNNDVLYVRGPGIEKMDLKIYNRWGQLVFESRDKSIGWDGTFKGQAQPTESYLYILRVTLREGGVVEKQGNINLLR